MTCSALQSHFPGKLNPLDGWSHCVEGCFEVLRTILSQANVASTRTVLQLPQKGFYRHKNASRMKSPATTNTTKAATTKISITKMPRRPTKSVIAIDKTQKLFRRKPKENQTTTRPRPTAHVSSSLSPNKYKAVASPYMQSIS